MNGTILFDDAKSLAEFMQTFCPCTATFEVKQNGQGFILKFLGGY